MSEYIDSSVTAPITPAPATPEPSAPPTSVSAPAATVPATPSTVTQPQATPGGEAVVPSYRLRQIREQYEQKIAQQEAAWQARYEATQKQLHSLVGVTPPANPEVDAVRQQFAQLYPGLSKMEERAAQIEALLARSGDLEQQTQHYWTTYGKQTLDRLFTKAGETLGGTISDAGKGQLHGAFVSWLNNDPERQDRYSNDPAIVDEFWKEFSSSLIDPVRRTATASVQDRVPPSLPQDAPGGMPRATPPSQPMSLDERMNQGWLQYNKFNR